MINYFKTKNFNTLIKQNLSSLFRFAYSRCKDRHLAEDLVQDTCIKAYKAYVKEEKEIFKFKEWVFKILINTHISYLRKRKLETCSDNIFNELENQECPITLTNSLEIREDINFALNFLNEEQREIIYLVEVEGYSFKETAELLGIPLGTVASRLQRSRIKLRELLTNMGYGNKLIKTGTER